MNEKLELAQILANHTPEEIAKASVESMGLHGIRVIKDLWHDYAAIPERNDTKTGPAMHSSGSGAEKAISEYSNPAPQIGIAEQYNMFAKQNVEEFGKMHSAMKAQNDAVLAKFDTLIETLTKKAEEKKPEEKKEEHKEEMKSETPATDLVKVASLWSHLGDLEEAVAKAEGEIQDINGLNSAKEHIEQAEKYLDRVEQHEMAEMVGMKAMTAINLGWRALLKATGLNSYDLKGYGNQVDAQVPGDETKDASSDDMKEAEAKANFYALKANRMRKAKGLAPLAVKAEEVKSVEAKAEEPKVEAKAEEKPEEKKEEHKEEMKADLVKFQEKQDEFIKASNERIKFLTDRIEQVTGTKAPSMVPVFVKSQGITSDNVAKVLNDRIDTSLESGELTDEDADTARSIVNMYQAVGKGHVTANTVVSRIDRSPLAVQSFFSSMESSN